MLEWVAWFMHSSLWVFPFLKNLFSLSSTAPRHILDRYPFYWAFFLWSRQILDPLKKIFELTVCSIDSWQILDPSRFLGSFSIDSRHISRFIEIILCALIKLHSNLTASRSVETLLHALFFTCFASFIYLVIHSILFYYIHAFIWIPCAP